MNETVPTRRLYSGGCVEETWSDEEVEFLKSHADDNSGSQIAAKMTARFHRRFTRNMISGKADRLGLQLRKGTHSHTEYLYRGPKRKRSELRPKTPVSLRAVRIRHSAPRVNHRIDEAYERRQLRREAKMFPDIETQFSQMFGAVSLVDVVGCHYPTQRGEFGDHLFCNAPIAFDGEVSLHVKNACPMYCRAHALIATQPRAS